MGRYEQAESLFIKAQKIREKSLGSEHLTTATSYNNLALLYKEMGRYQEAEPFFQKALMITETKLGRARPATAAILNNLALILGMRILQLNLKFKLNVTLHLLDY